MRQLLCKLSHGESECGTARTRARVALVIDFGGEVRAIGGVE
jgi:hypothetical protein